MICVLNYSGAHVRHWRVGNTPSFTPLKKTDFFLFWKLSTIIRYFDRHKICPYFHFFLPRFHACRTGTGLVHADTISVSTHVLQTCRIWKTKLLKSVHQLWFLLCSPQSLYSFHVVLLWISTLSSCSRYVH